MEKNTVLYIIVAALVGFIAGFWLANSINRSAQNTSVAQKTTTNTATSSTAPISAEPDLTEDEIKAKIADADRNAGNFAFQKSLGTALYRYASMKQNPDLLKDVVRILDRAKSLNATDFDVLVALGNAHFDIGFAEKETAEYQKAREIYTSALQLKPGDADVSTDLGLTYFLQEPPALEKAAAELQKVVDANPKHTRSMQFLVRVLIKQNKLPEAEKALAKLKGIDPNYDAIPDLTSEISDARNAIK